jgi:hypothetical protein
MGAFSLSSHSSRETIGISSCFRLSNQKSQIKNQKCVHAVLFVVNRPFGSLARKEGPLPTHPLSFNHRRLSNNS